MLHACRCLPVAERDTQSSCRSHLWLLTKITTVSENEWEKKGIWISLASVFPQPRRYPDSGIDKIKKKITSANQTFR